MNHSQHFRIKAANLKICCPGASFAALILIPIKVLNVKDSRIYFFDINGWFQEPARITHEVSAIEFLNQCLVF